MSRSLFCLCLWSLALAALCLNSAHAGPVIENNGALNIPESRSQPQSQESMPFPSDLYLEHRSDRQQHLRQQQQQQQQQQWATQHEPSALSGLTRLRRVGLKSLESGFHQLMRMFMSPIATIHRRSQVLRRRIQENRNGDHLILKRSLPPTAALNEGEEVYYPRSNSDSPRTLSRIIPVMQQSFSNMMDRFFLRNQNPENKESTQIALRFTNLMSMFPGLMERLRNRFGFGGNSYNSNRKIYHVRE